MDQPIPQHLPLCLEYSLPSEQDCIDIASHAHHASFATGPVVDPLRRESTLVQMTSLNANRLAPHPPNAHNSAYPSTSSLSDSGPGSISTSPSSSASSLAYATSSTTCVYPSTNPVIGLAVNPYPTASQVFPNQYSFSQPFSGMNNVKPRLASISDTTSGVLYPARSPGIGNPVSPTSSATIRDQYSTSTPGLGRHLVSPRSTLDSFSRSYNTFPETPRTMMSSSSMSLSPPFGNVTGMTCSSAPDSRSNESPPFLEQETIQEIYCDGHTVQPQIEAKIEKGFFYSSDNCWTCYRRNYFSVQCSYSLSPYPSSRALYLTESGQKTHQPIQALGICLSAAVDGPSGKTIELVQHTPKRDKGPQNPIHITKLSPTPPRPKQLHNLALPHGFPIDTFGRNAPQQAQPPPFLPLQGVDYHDIPHEQVQHSTYSSHQPLPTAHQHTFERIQFKSATANNGKRRAQQQYYHLIVELWADIRGAHDKEAKWKKIAQKISHQVVVRGRSPSHYQNEGPQTASTRGGPSGASGTGSGNLALGSGFGAAGYGFSRGIGNGVNHDSSYRGQTYRDSIYSLASSAIGGTSMSSASSSDGGPADPHIDHGKPFVMHSSGDEDDIQRLQKCDEYQYIPSPLYDNAVTTSRTDLYDPLRLKEDPYGILAPAAATSTWPKGTYERFRGTDSSRGLYPSVDTRY